ncbi:MAG: hypothetical protein WCI01_12515 [Chlorobiaceae bacterium]
MSNEIYKGIVRNMQSDIDFANEQIAKLHREKLDLEKEWSERLERFRTVLTESLQKAVNERDTLRDRMAKHQLEQKRDRAALLEEIDALNRTMSGEGLHRQKCLCDHCQEFYPENACKKS